MSYFSTSCNGHDSESTVKIVHNDNTFVIFEKVTDDIDSIDSSNDSWDSTVVSDDDCLYDGWSVDDIDWGDVEYNCEFPALPPKVAVNVSNVWQTQYAEKKRIRKHVLKAATGHAVEKIVIGGNIKSSVKAVTSSRCKSTQQTDRVEKGIFVSRVKPRTSARDIQQLVCDETGLSVKAEKLKTRYKSYSSFFIPCDKRITRRLLDKSVWPTGALVKVYEDNL